MLTHGPRRPLRNEHGSGTAIGVAMVFPMLMLVIMVLQMLSETARIEQALQAAANRAAQTAALCCYHTGGTNGAEEVAEASLAAAESVNAYNRIYCNNDLVGDSTVVFVDVKGNDVPNAGDRPVPPGGTVHVFLRCRTPPQHLGGFGFPGLAADRRAEGVASIDPYRFRAGA